MVMRRHYSNVTSTQELPCGHVMSLNYQQRCNFIRSHTGCHTNIHYIDYLNFIFCTVGTRSEYFYLLAVSAVLIICFYLFITLGTTADKFFCPALAVISKLMGLSENLAGVTLIAVGNGSPDLFTSLSNTRGDTELLYAQLMGAAVFLTGFVIGLVMTERPFKLVAKNYLRDVLFFIVAAIVVHNFIHDQQYTLIEGFITIGIYILYLTLVIVDHVRIKRKIRELRESSKRASEASNVSELLKKADDLESIADIKFYSRKSSKILLEHEISRVFNRKTSDGPNEHLLKTFYHDANPIGGDEWKEATCWKRLFMILKIPVVLSLTLLIPTVDYGEELHGWSKLLNMINVIVLPQALLVGFYDPTATIFSIPLALIIFGISLAIVIAIFLTTRNDCPPKYHVIFVIGSFAGSILVIYHVAKEVVSVMNAVGIISDMTTSMVGLSILAWGNSIGDVFSNLALAKHGYQQMALAACFGGPMFNTLLGSGLNFIIKAFHSDVHVAHVREGAMGPNCIIFLVIILFFTMLALLFTNFRTRKSIGIYCILVYCIFLLYCLLGEFGIMHPYGTDHTKT